MCSVLFDSLRPCGLWPLQVLVSMEFSRQKYWSGQPFPAPGDLPNPVMEPASLASPTLASRFFTTSTTWEAQCISSVQLLSHVQLFVTQWTAAQGTPKSLLQHHSSKASILRPSAFFIVQLSHPSTTTGKTTALTGQTFVGKVMSLLFNILSRLVIAFLPRSKRLLILWLQSPSAGILEPPIRLP